MGTQKQASEPPWIVSAAALLSHLAMQIGSHIDGLGKAETPEQMTLYALVRPDFVPNTSIQIPPSHASKTNPDIHAHLVCELEQGLGDTAKVHAASKRKLVVDCTSVANRDAAKSFLLAHPGIDHVEVKPHMKLLS